MAARWSTSEAVSVSDVRGKEAGGERRRRRAVSVSSVVLAAVGGALSLLVPVLVDASGTMAAEGNDPRWTASELAYIWVWVVVGVTVLCGAWLLSRRPWAGVCLTVTAVAVLLLNVTLLHPSTLLFHLANWCVVAAPLLLAAALGAWRALALRGDSRSSGEGPGDGASTDEAE